MTEGIWLYETPVESDFRYKGYRCLVKPNGLGYRCGYVMLPEGHPLEGDFDAVEDAYVHGGVTYFKQLDRHWVVGFDCAHIVDGDAKDASITPYYRKMLSEAVKRDMRCGSGYHENFEEFYSYFEGHSWTVDEVEDECRLLVDEIERIAGEQVIG